MTYPWRNHPRLSGRFLPESPDDVQVVVHDGGPRLTDHQPEAVWVTITGIEEGDVFVGRVLNQPQQLTTVTEGTRIKFLAPGGQHLIMVTDRYLRERGDWDIGACDQCGCDELFDAPADLIRVTFPNIPPDAGLSMFSAFCGLCGGVQVVQAKGDSVAEDPSESSSEKKWWQFWK